MIRTRIGTQVSGTTEPAPAYPLWGQCIALKEKAPSVCVRECTAAGASVQQDKHHPFVQDSQSFLTRQR